MQARKRGNVQGPKKTKRKRSEAEETFEEDELIVNDREDARNDDADEPEDPLADETPAEKRIRIGVFTTPLIAHPSQVMASF